MARDAMHSVSSKTFVGFGFGAIQAGLFLQQAQKSTEFDRLVIAYRRAEIIEDIRKNDGCFELNIAHKNHIEKISIGPIEIYDVNKPAEQRKIIEAIAEASEIATAVSSTTDYLADTSASIHRLLAKGLVQKIDNNKTACVIYTAENDKQAAQKLAEAIKTEISRDQYHNLENKLQILNTVIGKMSITIKDKTIIQKQQLSTISPKTGQAFLVEEFSYILIDKIKLANFKRAIKSFVEKDKLLPFEEAKLHGHNAIHAMAAYLALLMGLKYIKDLDNNILNLLQTTFMQEVGAALIKKYNGVDSLFTPEGFENYAENLLERMQNPYLNDSAERVGRDIKRKLGWNDRLIGSMRLCLEQGIEPKCLALGVAAALKTVNKTNDYKNYLESIWQDDSNSNEAQTIYILLNEALSKLKNIKYLPA